MSRPRPVQPERNNGDRGKLGRGQLMFREETASGDNSLHITIVFLLRDSFPLIATAVLAGKK